MKLKLNVNSPKIKIIKEGINNQQNIKKISFLFLLKKILYLIVIIFFIIISKMIYKSNIIKIIIKDNNNIFLNKNWKNISNENILNKIKISIIIPVYNTENFIEESLFSVLSQSIREIEIICVNDGSTDKSKEIIQKIASIQNRIILINQENKGVSSARNAALKFAIGEYILFLDPDDMFRSNSLDDLLNIANKEKVEVIYFDAFVSFMPGIIHDIGKINYYKRNKSYGFMSGKDLFSNIIIQEQFSDSACLMMINRKWLNNIKVWFIEGIIYEDCVFSLQIMMKANYAYHINEQFYIYRVRANSIMTSKLKPINLYSRLFVFRELLKLYINENFTFFQKKAFLKLLNRVRNEIRFFNGVVDDDEWNKFCKKKSFSIKDEMLLIMITKITDKINDLENFWKLSDTNNIEIYGIKENKLIEYYKIINKTEIIKSYIISNLNYNIFSINEKKVRILNDDQNIDKNETIVISVDEKKIEREKFKLNNLGYKNIIIMNDNLNRILSKLINEKIKKSFLKYNYHKSKETSSQFLKLNFLGVFYEIKFNKIKNKINKLIIKLR